MTTRARLGLGQTKRQDKEIKTIEPLRRARTLPATWGRISLQVSVCVCVCGRCHVDIAGAPRTRQARSTCGRTLSMAQKG